MAQLQILTAGLDHPVYDLRLGVNRVGRRPDNDFQINHHTVAGFHCEISLKAGIWSLRDQNSKQGTFLNGKRIKKVALAAGQTLHLGKVKLLVVTTDAAVAIPQFAKTPTPGPLMDSAVVRAACVSHPNHPITHQCLICQAFLCHDCIYRLGVKGRKKISLPCPVCGGSVRRLGGEQINPPPMVLADGTVLCPRHAKAVVAFKCTVCHEVMCGACVDRSYPRGATATFLLCPVCDNSVMPFNGRHKSPKKPLIARVSETVRLKFKRTVNPGKSGG